MITMPAFPVLSSPRPFFLLLSLRPTSPPHKLLLSSFTTSSHHSEKLLSLSLSPLPSCLPTITSRLLPFYLPHSLLFYLLFSFPYNFLPSSFTTYFYSLTTFAALPHIFLPLLQPHVLPHYSLLSYSFSTSYTFTIFTFSPTHPCPPPPAD